MNSNDFQFCDTLCMNCQSEGANQVNLVGYHRVCNKCIKYTKSTLMTCIHCLSIIKVSEISLPPLPLFQLSHSSPVLPHKEEEEKSELFLPNTSQHCLRCSKPLKERKIMKHKKNICQFCYSLYLNINFKFIENMYSKINLSDKRCSICRVTQSVKFCKCGFNLCLSCDQNNSCFCYSSGGMCSKCDSRKNVIFLKCNHKTCEDCLRESNVCSCNILLCEFCNSLCDSYKEVSVIGGICDDCIYRKKIEKVNKELKCKSCKEIARSYKNNYCKHFQCIYCNIGGECLKCRFSTDMPKRLPISTCAFCYSESNGQYLFCGHFACIPCSKKYKLKSLNYCCKNCILVLVKRCLTCYQLEEPWKVINTQVKKICCNKTYCYICLKKNSFFSKCSCFKS